MNEDQEAELQRTLGALEANTKTIFIRLDKMESGLEETKSQATRTREAVEGYASATVARITAIEDAIAKKAEGKGGSEEERDDAALGRTIRWVGKNWKAAAVLIGASLTAGGGIGSCGSGRGAVQAVRNVMDATGAPAKAGEVVTPTAGPEFHSHQWRGVRPGQ